MKKTPSFVFEIRKVIVLTLFLTVVLMACDRRDQCDNYYRFIHEDSDSIPLLNLNYNNYYNELADELTNFYGGNLCEPCAPIPFKIPFSIEGERVYLKIVTSFSSEYCKDCPLYIREHNVFQILINANNDLMIEGDVVEKGRIDRLLKEYLTKLGSDDEYPVSLSKINYSIQWDRGASGELIDDIFTSIYTSHLQYLKGRHDSFCSLDEKELLILRNKYLPKIEVPNSKSTLPPPLPIPKLSS